jgi:hypothetical protein
VDQFGFRKRRQVALALEFADGYFVKARFQARRGADAAHIATATVCGCEYLLTWNCRHIANAEPHRGIRRVVEGYGYEAPALCTPEEMVGEEP